MTDEIAERSRELIADFLGVSVVTDDQEFFNDFGLDSLDIVGLTMEAEDEFGIELFDEDLVKEICTVGDAVRMIKEAMK